jgi:hypothetical protein
VVSYDHFDSSTPSTGEDIRAAIYNADDSLRAASTQVRTIRSSGGDLPNDNFALAYTDPSYGTENGSYGIALKIFSAIGADPTPNPFIHVNVPSNVNELDAMHFLVVYTGNLSKNRSSKRQGGSIAGRHF